jgi:hypothetical protein
MPLLVGTRLPVKDGLQWIRYSPALAIVDCVHCFDLEIYCPRIRVERRFRVLSLFSWYRIFYCLVRLGVHEPYPGRGEKSSRVASCGRYLGSILGSDYLFLLGIFFITCRCSVLSML